MSDPPRSDIDFKNKMAWVLTTLKYHNNSIILGNFISNFPMRQRNPSQQSPVPSPASQNPVSPNPPMSPLLLQYPTDINNMPHQIGTVT